MGTRHRDLLVVCVHWALRFAFGFTGFWTTKTEPKPVGSNRFWFGFGFKILKLIMSIWLIFFMWKPDRTGNAQPYCHLSIPVAFLVPPRIQLSLIMQLAPLFQFTSRPSIIFKPYQGKSLKFYTYTYFCCCSYLLLSIQMLEPWININYKQILEVDYS